MSDFNALKFVADNAGLNIFKALEKAYEQGKADAAKEALDKDIDVPSKEETILVDYLNSRINDFRQRGSYAGRFAADLLEAIIKDYNKEVHNEQTE